MDSTQISFAKLGFSLDICANAISVKLQGTEVCKLSPHSAVERIRIDGTERIADRDVDKEDFSYHSLTENGKQVFLWKGSSNNWQEKIYRLECGAEGFSYFVRVHGEGRVGKICYFHGARQDNAPHGSSYEFCEYYVPTCDTFGKERCRYPSSMNYQSYFELMVPPMYCFAFRTADIEPWLGLGLIARPGEYNFTRYDYDVEMADRTSRFSLSTNMEGHTRVHGTWEAPFIRGFAGKNEFDVVAMYSNYHYDSGLCKRRNFTEIPRWWHGPLMCGWSEQDILARNTGMLCTEMANQAAYTDIVRRLEEKHLKPSAIIIDDKWQEAYGSARPHPDRWPDMRAFVDAMHAKNIRVLLWFRLWNGEGLDDSMRMSGNAVKPWNKDDNERYADPSHPAYRESLRKTIHFLLSNEAGCMNCDGFKLDYAFWMPYGSRAVSHSGEYGVELLKRLFQLIYTAAKEVKPDALINASPCHPYFAECCDQLRLHDYYGFRRNIKEVMTDRLRLFRIACPEQLIDTDGTGFCNRRDTMSYMRYAPILGVPDLYQISDSEDCHLTDEDWAEIAGIWQAYSEKIDAMYR